MGADRVVNLTIRGMRCIEDVKLPIGPFTVLVGENGAGKSTVVEAAELLRKAATEAPFVDRLYSPHDGTRLFRGPLLQLGVGIEGAGPPLAYVLEIQRDGAHLLVRTELLTDTRTEYLARQPNSFSWSGSDGRAGAVDASVDSNETVLSKARFVKSPELMRVRAALASIEVHVPLDLRSSWAVPQNGSTARSANHARPAERLDPGGTNLVNIFAKLKNQTNWRETVDRLSLLLGDVDDVLIQPAPSGGMLGLEIRWDGGLEVPLSGLSDGQVSALALIAIQQLHRKVPPSLVVVDEPEAHLHPGATRRVAAGLAAMGEDCPVLVATQSDAFLDAISDRPDAIINCRLDKQRRMETVQLDVDGVQGWLDDFRGVGELRREGLEELAFPRTS
jgi:predicted ATPase